MREISFNINNKAVIGKKIQTTLINALNGVTDYTTLNIQTPNLVNGITIRLLPVINISTSDFWGNDAFNISVDFLGFLISFTHESTSEPESEDDY